MKNKTDVSSLNPYIAKNDVRWIKIENDKYVVISKSMLILK